MAKNTESEFAVHLRLHCCYAWDIINRNKSVEIRMLAGRSEQSLRRLKMGDLVRFEIVHGRKICMDRTANACRGLKLKYMTVIVAPPKIISGNLEDLLKRAKINRILPRMPELNMEEALNEIDSLGFKGTSHWVAFGITEHGTKPDSRVYGE